MSWNRKKRPPEERFWEKVEKTDGCWNWTGGKDIGGYGCFGIDNKKRAKAHRYSWELLNGKIPAGLQVNHHCDNPPCVRPEHLWLGTQKENMRDSWNKGRQDHRGEKNSNSILTNLQVRILWHAMFYMKPSKFEGVFGASRKTLHDIAHSRKWKHII